MKQIKFYEAMLIMAVVTNQLEKAYGKDSAKAIIIVSEGNPNQMAALLAAANLMPDCEKIFPQSSEVRPGIELIAAKFDPINGIVYGTDTNNETHPIEFNDWLKGAGYGVYDSQELTGYCENTQKMSKKVSNISETTCNPDPLNTFSSETSPEAVRRGKKPLAECPGNGFDTV